MIHGGCWLAQYDLEYMGGLAASLTEAGMATWSIEYRRVGDEVEAGPGPCGCGGRDRSSAVSIARNSPSISAAW